MTGNQILPKNQMSSLAIATVMGDSFPEKTQSRMIVFAPMHIWSENYHP